MAAMYAVFMPAGFENIAKRVAPATQIVCQKELKKEVLN